MGNIPKDFALYFIALIPPPDIAEEAWRLKQYFKDTYNSRASLNSPPHITLHMPFRWKEDKEEQLAVSLDKFTGGFDPFPVELSGFNSFPPRVIFIEAKPTAVLLDIQRELTRYCRKTLNLFNADYRDLPFHPHITLAFRDLKKKEYALAWNEFEHKPYQAQFMAQSITLLKHTGREWKPFREHFLQSSTPQP